MVINIPVPGLMKGINDCDSGVGRRRHAYFLTIAYRKGAEEMARIFTGAPKLWVAVNTETSRFLYC